MREQSGQQYRSGGRRGGRSAAVPLLAAVAVGVLTAGALAQPAAFAAARPDSVQQGLTALVRSDGMPGALASVEDRDGHTRTYTAGVGDLATGAAVPRNGQVRIGSNTKAFTAVVVLQLVGEGKIGLDDPVDTHLPGLVRGEGIDGRNIRVRHLLQHTSGLPDYLDDDLLPRPYEPRELLGFALRHKAAFEPGKKWAYSNTNYVLAGLIVEKVTGHPLAEELERRVIRRAGLRHTYFPSPATRASANRIPGATTAIRRARPCATSRRWTPPGPGRRVR